MSITTYPETASCIASPWQEPRPVSRGAIVYAAGGRGRGKATGSFHRCRLEGCRGVRIAVRWPGGRLTYPCTAGMEVRRDGRWQIRSDEPIR